MTVKKCLAELAAAPAGTERMDSISSPASAANRSAF